MNKIELLAPAKNLENLEIAFKFGADAVYLGGQQFSLRARNSNFNIEKIKKGLEITRKYKGKLFITLNMVAHEEDIKKDSDLKNYLLSLKKIGVDALIVSDLGILSYCRKIVPTLDIHISTQASTSNSYALSYFKEKGAKRVILARECNLEEIEKITKKNILETEVFIHGGMCMAISGRCVLSNYLTNRDANRGGCAHSCRWYYDIFDHKHKKVSKEKFTFSAKDLETTSFIENLIKAGATSLKIEGRMKSEHYLAVVVSVYRKIIDAYYENKKIDKKEMKILISKAANRKTSSGFLNKMSSEKQSFSKENEIPTQKFIAKVLSYNPITKLTKIEQRNHFSIDQEFEIIGSSKYIKKFKIKSMYDENDLEVKVGKHAKQILYFKSYIPLSKDDMIRRK